MTRQLDPLVSASSPAVDQRKTQVIDGSSVQELVRRFALVVSEGPRKGFRWDSASDCCTIGSHPSNQVVLDDLTASRFHCEIRIDQLGARIIDLDSRNGTLLDHNRIIAAYLQNGSLIRIGQTVLRFEVGSELNRVELSSRAAFGSLVGSSRAMRATFALLERAGASDATVLIEGETGTGKEGAARGIHEASLRRQRPFVVVDCSAIPANLLESELFGHERGAFTGAVAQRIGAFEEANGGTVFIDEIGELPADLQPKLLRVLERREVRRIGGNMHRPVDVRVVAATNRNLRAEVNAGRFRSDVYYRLAVVRVPIPALREHLEDLPILVDRTLQALKAPPAAMAELTSDRFIAMLRRSNWPGNVRELRNYLERCLVFNRLEPIIDDPVSGGSPDWALPYEEARAALLDDFERRYVTKALEVAGGRVGIAAKATGLSRVYLYKLIHKHGLKQFR